MDEEENSPAWLDGWHAHKNNYGPMSATNPYSEDTQVFSHFQWMMGHARRRDACKHGRPLTHDD